MLSHWARLYAKPTPSELALEPAIAALGLPYRFQHPVFAAFAIADFAFPTLRIIIEVDGVDHKTRAKVLKDQTRTAKLNALGWRVFRCDNYDALTDPYGTVTRLMAAAGVPAAPRPPATTQPTAAGLPSEATPATPEGARTLEAAGGPDPSPAVPPQPTPRPGAPTPARKRRPRTGPSTKQPAGRRKRSRPSPRT